MKNGWRQGIQGCVLDLVSAAEEKYTQNRLMEELIKTGCGDRASIRKAIRELVECGELSYAYQYGCSILEKSIHRVNRISERLSLAPVGVHEEEENGKWCVKLSYGASFGTGRHPTTRLSIQAMDCLMRRKFFYNFASKGTALDIGTGSGVLAIAAVKLGMSRAIGVDIESISRKEAEENVAYNGLSEKIEIVDQEVNEMAGNFSLILANLRLPTLKELAPAIRRLSTPWGGVVLSGVKTEELPRLKNIYERNGFLCIWEKIEKGWACQSLIHVG